MGPAVLGVGMVHVPGLEPVLEAGADLIDVIEIEPQLRRAPDGRYQLHDRLFAEAERFGRPKLVHGVGFPVGSTRRPDARDLSPLAEAIERAAPPWASEHLSFNQAQAGGRDFFGGFLLPPVQTARSARNAAGNIRAVQQLLPVPFAFETGVNYLTPQPGEMTDGAFFAAVAEQADCGILLDLHNMWCNERNGRQAVFDALAEMPLERVWEVHLAGGSAVDGLWLDAHSSSPPEPLYELAEQVLPALPNLGAVIFEISPQVIGQVGTPEILAQLRRMRSLWDRSRQAAGPAAADRPRITGGSPRFVPAVPDRAAARAPVPGKPRPAPGPEPDPGHWEAALAAVATNVPSLVTAVRAEHGDDLVDALAADRCIPTLQRLIRRFREGVIATALPLTFRMIMFHGGEQAFHDLLSDFWQENPLPRFLFEEPGPILGYLQGRRGAIPHLEEVAAYEVAAQQVQETGTPQRVRFSCEPVALLTDLSEYRRPVPVADADYEVLITA